MNLLQLVQLLQQESSGVQTITTAQNQTGELKRMVDWVKQANMAIQRRHTNWRWMRKGVLIQTLPNTESIPVGVAGPSVVDYDIATGTVTSGSIWSRFSRWHTGDLMWKAWDPIAGENTSRWLNWLEYDEFRQLWLLQPQPASSSSFYTVDPNNAILLGPPMQSSYSLVGEYQRNPITLTDDDDEPEFPERFHELIVWEALKKYGYYESAQEAIMRANFEASQLWHALEADQKPATNFSDALC